MNELIVEQKEHICTLTINRPEKHNVLDMELLELLLHTMDVLSLDQTTRVVVLRGMGERAFSAGFNLGHLNEQLPERESNPLSRFAESVRSAPFPVIAMIHGYCLGGGLELAVCSDLRFASEDALLGMPPAKLGLVYPLDNLARFIEAVGAANAKELFLSGRRIAASRARDMGLVNYVLPKEELASFTYAFAGEIAENAPLALRGMKHTIDRLRDFPNISNSDRAALKEFVLQAARSRDFKEGRQARLEKRKPRFEGR